MTDSIRAWVADTRRLLAEGATPGRTVVDGALDRLEILLGRMEKLREERDAALACAVRLEAMLATECGEHGPDGWTFTFEGWTHPTLGDVRRETQFFGVTPRVIWTYVNAEGYITRTWRPHALEVMEAVTSYRPPVGHAG